MRLTRMLACGLVWLAVTTCGGGDGGGGSVGPGTDPGTIIVTYGSSVTSIGAIQFVVPKPSGGAVTSLAPMTGFTAFTKDIGNGTIRVILTGNFSSGAVASFQVPDRNVISSYTPIREAAADRSTYALHAGSDFSLSISKAGGTSH